MIPLKKSIYSNHFNHLVFLGAWVPDYEGAPQPKINFHATYRLVINMLEICGAFGLIYNLVEVYGDLRKMSWNICITTLLVGISVKTLRLMRRNRIINDLRMSLHRDAEVRKTEEDVLIQDLAAKELRQLQILLYGTGIVFIPAWIFTKYFVHRELPIPFPVPFFNLEDSFQFHIAFLVLSFTAIYGLVVVVETQLAMFAIIIQISREYKVLLKDISKLDEIYDLERGNEGTGKTKREVNPWLKTKRTKTMVKQFCSRFKEIIEYMETFELCYSVAFLEEVFGTSIIFVAISAQSLLGDFDISGDFVYQMGYLFGVTFDMFFICWFATKLQTQCFQVGEAAYSTSWYQMSTEIQKDIFLLIMRSQNPPKITTGKLMELNLPVFMHRMSNIYSWLTLLRQLEFKALEDA